jgi:hypothetical protein
LREPGAVVHVMYDESNGADVTVTYRARAPSDGP